MALLTTSELPKGRGLHEKPLFADEIVFVMASHHPLAQRRRITPLQLQAEQLITGNTPPAEASWFVRAAFGRRRPKLRFSHFPLTEAIIDTARAGMGIAVLRSGWRAATSSKGIWWSGACHRVRCDARGGSPTETS